MSDPHGGPGGRGGTYREVVPRARLATTHTFVFADLAGYAAFTESHGDDAAARAAITLSAEARRLANLHDAHFVKSMGDGVLVAAHSAAQGICVGLHMVEELGSRPGSNAIRVGMHTGPAVGYEGDWFGAAVNLAARVGALAGPGDVVATQKTVAAAGRLDELEIRDLGTKRLRHVIDPVRLFGVTRGHHALDTLTVDPVCLMIVDPATALVVQTEDGPKAVCSKACEAAMV